MSKSPDMCQVSKALSEVLDDIRVNERFVMKRRRMSLLNETIRKLLPNKLGRVKVYYFGSQSEGSTTLGLDSDVDVLISFNWMNVIQSRSEYKPGFVNCVMKQNENISPGYCYLHAIGPLPKNVDLVTDSVGRVLWKNTSTMVSWPTEDLYERHGPALTHPGTSGSIPNDIVYCFYCKSSPHQVTSWLQRQRDGKWPTEDVLEHCRTAGCFVVPVGSKVHSPDILESVLEWRISTSLQERYLMFSLNITQLRCYILMKMILKTHINSHVKDVLSSFMCKNVLLYCIANSTHDWHTGNLLSYLHLCLFMLKECIEQRNCPHFIIPENNLLAGHMSDMQRCQLLDILNKLIENNEYLLLFAIPTDYLGLRLKMKLNMKPNPSNLPSAAYISLMKSGNFVYITATTLSGYITQVLKDIKHEGIETALLFLSQTCYILARCRNGSDSLLSTVCDFLLPLVSSALGSVLACAHIDIQIPISDQAFNYLEAGKESDVLSGRLKLVSVLYCTGDMERAEREIATIQTQYNISEVHTFCGCYSKASPGMKIEGTNNFEDYGEKAIKTNVAFCTKFLQCEINCVPHELRYEMFRYFIDEDRQTRSDEDIWWMDCITVDSMPYLIYLRYKTYGHLQRRNEQIQALHLFARTIKFELNLKHEETALNLLGQCLEHEDKQAEALQYYIQSLKYRQRNNAARLLLCIQLFKLQKLNKTS